MVKYRINITAGITIEEVVPEPPEPEPELPLLRGFSGTPEAGAPDGFATIEDAMDAMIDELNTYGGNVMRLSYTPSWTGGTRPWDPTQIDYFLDNWGGFIIVDRNHHTSGDDVPTLGDDSWDPTGVEAGVFEVLALWPNHPRVLVEIINEYVPRSVPPGAPPVQPPLYPEVQDIIDNVRAAGYTNWLVLDKHTNSDDWADYPVDPLGKFYAGKHFYMNNYTQAEFQGHMNNALNAGLELIVNTEMGAHFGEFSNFTQALVDELELDQAWLSARGLGYCIWLNKNVRNLIRGVGVKSYEFYNWEGFI